MAMSNDQDQGSDGCDMEGLLHERHARIRDGFANVIDAEGAVKAALFDELVTILAVREAVARELIRPLVERQGHVRPAEPTGPAEETDVMTGLSRLSSMDVDHEDFDVELIGVARTVTLDMEAQEREHLPLLCRSLPAGELKALAELLISAETIAKASASAIKAEAPSPDTLGPRDVYAALEDTIRRANRP